MAFLKPNYTISEKTVELSGTQALPSGLGRGGGSWQLQNSWMSGSAVDQVSLISTALPGAQCLHREQAPVPTFAWTRCKGGQLRFEQCVSSGYTEHSFRVSCIFFASLILSFSFL